VLRKLKRIFSLQTISFFILRMLKRVFSLRAISLMSFDLLKLRARIKCWGKKELAPGLSNLHLGCGGRIIPGWLNVDILGSEFDVDLSRGRLPWKSNAFDAIVSQHFIEHLEIRSELVPLFRELHRVIKPQGEIWLSCPDIEKICRSYINYKMIDLLEDKRSRWPAYSTRKLPASHLINDLFHQSGQHKNLFDFAILEWLLHETGFTNVKLIVEADLLTRFPTFPPRNDDLVTIYVKALAI
jgi:predicted SAM-dependent methyltransferase